MPLETQPVDIPLGGGLQQSLDPHLVPQGGWLKLRNLRRNRQQGFSKRFGTTALPRDIFGGGTLSSCQIIGSLDDVLLAVDDNNVLYEFSSALQKWINRSQRSESPQTFPLYPVTLDHRGLYGISNRIVTFDWCVSPDGLIHAALEIEDTSGDNKVLELVFDSDNGALIKGPTQVDVGFGPRIISVGTDTVVIVYADKAAPGKLQAREKTTTGAYGAATDLVAAGLYVADNNYAWDVRTFDSGPASSNSFILVYERADHVITYKTFTLGPITVQYTGTSASVGFQDYQAFAIASAATESGFWVAWSRTDGGGVPLVKFTFVTVSVGLPESFAPATCINAGVTATFGTPGRLGIVRINDTKAEIMLGACESLPQKPAMQSVVVTNAGGLDGPASYNNQVWPASRPFVGVDGLSYIWVRDLTYLGDPTATPPETLAGSLMLVDTQALGTIAALRPVGRVVARGPVRALEVSEEDFICGRVLATPLIIGNKVYCPAPMLRQLKTKQRPIERVWATWEDPKRLRFVQLGGSAYIQPGEVFDRNRPIEIGFHKIPNALEECTSLGGGGSVEAGDRAYCIVLRRTNAAGEMVRSCPSGPRFVTTVATDIVHLQGLLCSYTDAQSTDSALDTPQVEYQVIEIYRTEAAGDTFFLVDELPMPTSGTTGIKFTYNDTLSDSDLISKPILYTGALAANMAPPNLRSIVVWQGNLVGIGPDSHTIWISNQPQIGEQVIFNEKYNAYVPNEELSALGVVDDKLIAFSKSSAWLIDGTRADSLGDGNTLFPQSISAYMGCIDERGLVNVGEGIVFRDQRAFALLNRNLQMEPLGLGIQDDIAAEPVVHAALHTEIDHEACFPVSAEEDSTTGQVLRYNATVQQWITSDYRNPNTTPPTNRAAIVSMAFINRVWYLAFADGTILKEDQTLFTDSGAYVEDELLTPWIRVGAIAGHQRTKRVLLQAERMSPHDIYIEVCQDLSEDVLEGMSETWTSGWIADLPEYPIEKLEKHLPYQKGSAVRIRVKSKTPTDEAIGTGEGPKYFGLTLLIGAKQGMGKNLNDANRK